MPDTPSATTAWFTPPARPEHRKPGPAVEGYRPEPGRHQVDLIGVTR